MRRQREFIEQLGELPADLGHRAFLPGVSTTAPSAAPASAARPQTAARRPLRATADPTVPGVTSVYDTRPIASRDFFIPRHNDIGGPGTFSIGAFRVPIGYVAVLRGVTYWLSPMPVAGTRLDYQLTLQTGGDLIGGGQLQSMTPGAPVFDYANIPVGVGIDSMIPMHVIIDQGRTIGLSLRVFTALIGPFSAGVEFYGQFLLYTGQPTAWEIGTHRGAP